MTARSKGAAILARQAVSERTFRDKLRDADFGDDEIDECAGYFLEIGYLDDEKFARGIAKRYFSRGKDAARVEFEIRKRGVDRLLAREVIEDYEEEREYDVG